MSNDWIKLHRQLLDSRVFSDDFLFRLWIWCLLKANWKQGWFQKRSILPGQFATGKTSASSELGVSCSKWNRGMKKLAEFGNVKLTVVNHQFTIVEVVNWRAYQCRDEESETPPEQQRNASGTPAEPIEEGKKGRREESSIKRESGLPEFIPPTAAEVQKYIDQRHQLNPNWPVNSSMTGEAFVDHYEGQGWLKGNGIPIRDWKAVVRTWGKKSRKKPAKSDPKPSLDISKMLADSHKRAAEAAK